MKIRVTRNPIPFKELEVGHVFLREDDVNERRVIPYQKTIAARMIAPGDMFNAILLAGLIKDRKPQKYIDDKEIVYDITDYCELNITQTL